MKFFKDKAEIIVVIILIIFSIVMRLSLLPRGDFEGSDTFYHYSVLKQSVENGKLSNYNNLDHCYDGVKSGHPLGFYILPYLLSYIIGLKTAFLLSPIIYAIITIIIGYLFFKKLFGKRISIITCLLIAASLSHLTRSSALTFRGDNIIYPFLLGSLYLSYSFLADERKNLFYSISAGILSALALFFWNGSIIVIIFALSAVILFIIFNYFTNKNIRLKYVIFFLITHSIFSYSLILLFHLEGKIREFYFRYFYIFSILIILFLSYLFLTRKLKIRNKILLMLVFFIISSFFFFLFYKSLLPVLEGFGGIKGEIPIVERMPPTLDFIWFYYWILIPIIIIGPILFFEKFNAEKCYIIGWIIPVVYMFIAARRYHFLLSIPICIFAAFYFNLLYEKRFKKIIYIISAIVIAYGIYLSYMNKLYLPILIPFALFLIWKYKWKQLIIFSIIGIYTLYSFHAMQFHPDNLVTTDLKDAFNYIVNNTPKDSCIISSMGWGGMIQYYTGRHSYTSSVGGWDENRWNEYYSLLFANNTFKQYQNKSYYVLVNLRDLIVFYVYAPKLSQNNSILLFSFREIGTDQNQGFNVTYYTDPVGNAIALSYNASHKWAYLLSKGDWIIKDIYDKNNEYHYTGSIQSLKNYTLAGSLVLTPSPVFILSYTLPTTNLISILRGKDLLGLELVYSNDRIRIYKPANNEKFINITIG